MAFLDEIGHGQAVMAESGRQRDHQTHMGSCEPVQRGFIPLLPPSDSELSFLLALEEGSIHGGTHEPATNP